MLGTFESSLRRSDRSRGSVRGRGRTVSPRPGSSTTDAGLHYLSGSPTPSVASTRPSSGLSDRMPPGSVSSASSVSSVTNRLYHSSTLASAAKTRPAPPERPPERPLRRTNLVELASKVVKTSDFQEGPRVSQLITLEISDEDERAHSGGTVMRRRRSLPNITPAPTAEQPGTPRSGRRRATAGARPRAAESPAGTDPPYGGSLDRRRVARKDGYQRRLGSDGSSASSSPARSDSPTPPGSPAPTGRRRAHCHSQPRPTRDKTPPPFELTLRRSVSVPAKSMGKCDGKSANRSASARKPLTKTQSAGGGGRSGEGLNDESTPLSRTASDSRVEQLLREARKARELGLAEPRRALIYFPVRSMKKQNGKSFKDLTRILEEHHVDTTDTAKTEDQLASEKAWLDAEQVWLVHKDGFSAARLLRTPAGAGAETDPPASGRVRIRLQDTGETIEVDEDDIEKANPPQFDQCEELSQLRHLNESSVLHTLRQRYGGNLIHTAAGASTVVINPMSSLAIYSDKVIQMFRGCKPDDMPPHIYSTAQTAYRALLSQRQDQSVVLLGRSGSGKTTNARHLINYLVTASTAAAPPNANRAVTVEKLAAAWALLEAFGNCRTVLNTNATRFTSVFSLDFDQSGQAASGSIQVLMLERDRVVRRPEGEPSFHVFYQLLAGADPALRQRLQLDDGAATGGDGVGFVTPLQRVEDRQRAAAAWARLLQAAATLSVQPAETDAIWSVLAAIVHLGVAGVSKGPSDKYQFADPAAARRAAALLGVRLEDLARAIFASQSSGAATLARSAYRTPPRAQEATQDLQGREALEAFVAGLYGDLVGVLVSLINRAISSPAHTINSVVVVDAPGLQNPSSCGRPGGATFDEFCFNYAQERLQLLFHEQTFIHERDRYAQENIALNMSELEGDVSTPAPLVHTLDRSPATRLVRSSQTELRNGDRRGLLWLLDEEALQPTPSDAGFLQNALDMYSSRADQQVLTRGPAEGHLVLQHFQGTNPVSYNVHGWVRAARETAASRAAATMLHESTKESLSRLFVSARGAGLGPAVSGGSVVGIDGSLSLRRASSIRRTFTSGAAGIKRNSRALLVKFQLDGVVEQLRRTRARFVHCLLPQHTAGLCELRPATANTTAPSAGQKTASPEEIIINVPLLRSQLRGAQLLDALRLHKQGYPEHMPFAEFRRRFALLAPDVTVDEGSTAGGDERAAVDQLMLQLDVDPASYRLGLSQIFFRSSALPQLEERRDERLQDKIVRFQARCRGLLARRQFARRKVQDVAIRCIQKNVRKYVGVRDWPWWRLLVRVTPLLDVHRTEQQLQSATEELATLRERVEKLEKENTVYKHENDKLESKLGEVTADLAEEHHTATLATERLEAEQAERMRLESDLQSTQSEFKKTSALNERLEKELLYRRASAELSAIGSDGSDGSDELGSATAYQRKYEYTARELAYTKQRLEQQHEDDVEQMMVLKKQLDKKVEAAYEEVEEQRQVVAQQKRKVARLTGEANDLRIHLEEQTSRNTVLEKKQRKFDIDMHALQEDLRREKQQREVAVRQVDQLQREKCSLENDVAAMRLELEMQEEKVSALRRELDEMGVSGGSEDEVAALRRSRLELQHKCQEQEEELDDMAGQLSLLEQAKLRLEMSLEQMRKEHRREVAQKDDEVEEVRANASKKLKALEAQLETEHEERTALVREKHELERRIIMLNESTISQDDQEAILKLKRDLKRTRALLKDTQSQLEKARSEASSKVQIRQLKNQLEDAEFARNAAVKARQSLSQELQETQALLEEAQRARTDTETRYLTASRELHQLQAQVDDQEEETQEVMKKYKAAVAQLSVDQLTLQDQASQLTQLEAERAALREQLAEQATRLDALQGETASAHDQRRLELRVRELESRCEFEQTTKLRLETQAARLKEAIEKAGNEAEQARQREQQSADQLRKLQRQLRESKDQLSEAERKESDAVLQARSLAKELEISEGEVSQARADLKLAFKRISDLQNAMQCELESEPSDSDAGSDSDEDLDSFLSAHMATGAGGGRRTSAAASGQPLSILTDGRSAGSESTPLSPLSLTSDPELRPRQNGALESDA
ncbi:unconventional myosin-XVIIIa-like isoform X2 [Amphibalanus amphitrite]|uniref:unconventional myosin-XVIIIa-like isoform X2 n=1 Tax=Amphibalanus amphitrite TaxID=1232801 RepID=UPI001C909A7B|nr:unconventional myosin-XVIIIa-like isoform X2 [Amphibalanus amphitrite]